MSEPSAPAVLKKNGKPLNLNKSYRILDTVIHGLPKLDCYCQRHVAEAERQYWLERQKGKV
jgi:hypothetical protein